MQHDEYPDDDDGSIPANEGAEQRDVTPQEDKVLRSAARSAGVKISGGRYIRRPEPPTTEPPKPALPVWKGPPTTDDPRGFAFPLIEGVVPVSEWVWREGL